MHRSTHPVAGLVTFGRFRSSRRGLATSRLHLFATFRLNRRRSNARGLHFHRLAQQAVALGPAPYRQIVATNQPAPALEATCVKGIPTFGQTTSELPSDHTITDREGVHRRSDGVHNACDLATWHIRKRRSDLILT